MLTNGKITLRPISVKDTDFILSLRNDTDISQEFISDPPMYDFTHEQWIKNRTGDFLDFIIVVEGDDAGRIYVYPISYRHQHAEMGIVLMKDFRKKDIAYKAGILLIDYIFTNLPIRKIFLHVFSDNADAIRLYNRLGFRTEGIFKEEYYKNGTWRDITRMALFTTGWKKGQK